MPFKDLKSFFAFIRFLVIPLVIGYACALAPISTAKHYNIRAGALSLNLSGTLNLEYNDNITSSGVNQLSDIIIRPGIIVEGEWRISDINVLELSIGANYNKYLRNSELDSQRNFVALDKDSKLELIMRIGPATVTFSDVFHFSADPTDAPAVDASGNSTTGVDTFTRFINDFKIETNFNFQDIQVDVGVSRHDQIPFESRFNFTQRTEYKEYVKVGFVLDPTMTVGVTGGLSQNRYREDFQNNSNGLFFGPTIEWRLSRLLSLNGEILYSKRTFENNGTNGDSSQSQSLDTTIAIKHKMNKRYSHSLRYKRSANIGSISNTTNVNDFEYNWLWHAFKRTDLKGKFSYALSKDSGGLQPEDFKRFKGSVEFGYRLTKKSTFTFLYAYSKKNSNIDSRTFSNNRFVLGFLYDF